MVTQVMKNLVTQYMDSQLFVFGNGSEKEKLESCVYSLGLSGNVKMLEIFRNIKKSLMQQYYVSKQKGLPRTVSKKNGIQMIFWDV